MRFPQYSSDKQAPKIGAYAFASIGGTAVARNITLVVELHQVFLGHLLERHVHHAHGAMHD